LILFVEVCVKRVFQLGREFPGPGLRDVPGVRVGSGAMVLWRPTSMDSMKPFGFVDTVVLIVRWSIGCGPRGIGVDFKRLSR
jgi:hypothetical protein